LKLLPPSEGNPRNTEGAFVTLKDGRILLAYSRFSGTSDHAAATITGRFSSDGGRTWTETDTPVVGNEGGMNVMSVSLLRLADGRIALFYLRKNSLGDCRPWNHRTLAYVWVLRPSPPRRISLSRPNSPFLSQLG
jgi:hypothetical protein